MRRIGAVLLPILLFACLNAQETRPSGDRVMRWREDLKIFSATLHGVWSDDGKKPLPPQKDLAKLYPTLDRDIEALTGELGTLRDGEIQLRIARILASAHVAHNLAFPSAPRRLPILVNWRKDGPIIVGASAEYRSTIGAQIKAIGETSANAVLDLIAPYISYETQEWKRTMAANLVLGSTLLEMLHLASNGHADLTLEGPSGESVISMAFAPLNTRIVEMNEVPGFMVPLAQSKPNPPNYWSQYLDEQKVLYIQYNRCAEDPKQPFAEFVKNALSEADSKGVRRVIVDLRFNLGGNSQVIRPLIEALATRRKTMGTAGLIGEATFSSGVMAAEDLREKAKAKLVGAPTGGLLRGYGESPSMTLPNSRLSFQYTIKKFGSSGQIKPDLVVASTVADLRAGRDVVLEAALKAP